MTKFFRYFLVLLLIGFSSALIAANTPKSNYVDTNGKNVNLKNRNLRIIDKEKYYEIHYSFDKPDGRICGDKEIGIDKGYSEAFTDSDGVTHKERQSLSRVLTPKADN